MSTTERKRMDNESSVMIFEGVTVSQAAKMFAMDIRDVKAKIAGKVTPVGERSGSSTYLIKDIAPHLIKPVFSEEELDRLIHKMSLADLPPILKKEYWAARRSQQAFEREAATLVDADEVGDMISELMKTLRMGLLLTRDLVERETELTDTQRHIVTENIDRTLESLRDEVQKRFTEIRKRKATIKAFDEELSRVTLDDEDEEL